MNENRLNQIDIVISSQRNMAVNSTRVITVLNEKGLSEIDAVENYNKKTAVKEIEATIFDGSGKEIKKIKRKYFKDNSAAGGSTLFLDSRYIYLDYTPTQYPFTVVYESKLETSTTAFIPQWYPISNFFVSVEKSVLNVSYPDNLGFKKMEFNSDDICGFSIIDSIHKNDNSEKKIGMFLLVVKNKDTTKYKILKRSEKLLIIENKRTTETYKFWR